MLSHGRSTLQRLLATGFTLLIAACGSSSSTRGNDLLEWNELVLRIIEAEQVPPPNVSRALAMMHTAIFDALVAVHGTYRPYAYDGAIPVGAYPPGLVPINDSELIAAAAHASLAGIFPNHQSLLDAQLATVLLQNGDLTGSNRGVTIGRAAGAKIASLRYLDQITDSPSVPTVVPGVWRETAPDFWPPLHPFWGRIKPFTMTTGDQFRKAGPPALASVEYATAVEENRLLGSLTSTTRTADQTQIAKFWANGVGTVTPPGHWARIAMELATAQGLDTLETSRLLALVSLALADAAISCWDMKYTYWLWRPITAIREASSAGNPGVTEDTAWLPLIKTPSFPEYTSGHSTFSAAAARILALYFGRDDLAFSTTSPVPSMVGVTRSYASFTAAAAEAGRSRIYGGIHYSFSDADGQATGVEIADQIWNGFLRPL